MLKVGVTGGIGSGKSTVLHFFSVLGVPVYDSDSRSRWLQENNPKIIEETKLLLGNDAYLADNKLNKPYIANKVFSDKATLEKLNAIVHPRVFEDSVNWYCQNEKHTYVIKESALLFESGMYKNLDKVISVVAPIEMRMERIKKRDSYRTNQEINAIISKQTTDEEKIKKSDFVIVNDETQLLISQVLAIHQLLTN